MICRDFQCQIFFVKFLKWVLIGSQNIIQILWWQGFLSWALYLWFSSLFIDNHLDCWDLLCAKKCFELFTVVVFSIRTVITCLHIWCLCHCVSMDKPSSAYLLTLTSCHLSTTRFSMVQFWLTHQLCFYCRFAILCGLKLLTNLSAPMDTPKTKLLFGDILACQRY